MRVKWLRGAMHGLDREAEYLARENPEAAARFVLHMRDSALMLCEQPNLGRPGRIPGTRELVVSSFPYILPYRIRNDAVEILRVFHASRRGSPRD